MARLTLEAAQKQLAEATRLQDVARVFRRLPKDLPAEPVVHALLGHFDAGRTFLVTALRGEPPERIRAVIEALGSRREFVATYLRAATANAEGDEALISAWQHALDGYLWHRPDFAKDSERVRIEKAAADQTTLNAVMAAVATSEEVPSAMLAVAIASGDEAALDALLPHVARAERDAGRLDDLIAAMRFAPKGNEAFARLGETLQSMLLKRSSASPLTRHLKTLGIDAAVVKENFVLRSVERAAETRYARATLMLTFDSAATEWVVARVWRAEELAGGVAMVVPTLDAPDDPVDIPSWLLELGAAFSVRWDWPGFLRGSLTEPERVRLREWFLPSP